MSDSTQPKVLPLRARSRQHASARGFGIARRLVVGLVMLVVILGVALGALSHQLTAAVTAVITAAAPVVIFRGLPRLLHEQGVTSQAVAGALAIYLSTGLLFAWIVSFIAYDGATPYFAQNTNGTDGTRLYFSFTVMTTTGFGDFSAATPAGRALAVIEMLTGQLYLVTVIGLLIGNFASRRETTKAGAAPEKMPAPERRNAQQL